jgi:hypothetical protein
VLATSATGWALAAAIVAVGLLVLVAVVSRRVGAERETWEDRLRSATREARWLDGMIAHGPPAEDVSVRLDAVVAELHDLGRTAPDAEAAVRADRLANALAELEDSRTDRSRSAVRQAIEAVEYAG